MSHFVGDDLEALGVCFPSDLARCHGWCALMSLSASEGCLLMLQPMVSDNLSERALDDKVVAKNRSN